MAAEAWTERRVEEIAAPSPNALATGPFGSAIGSSNFVSHGVPVIRGSNLSQDVGVRLREDGLVFLSPEKAREFSRSLARQGDLVFTCWGTIDQVGLIDNRSRYPEYVVSNKQMKLTPDPRQASSLFLYYVFASPLMRDRILSHGIGSSVPGFNLGQLRSLTLKLPPLTEQRAIAHILGTLDDKIELNRRMNETLEAMARALFQSWFVDFDPVRAKAEGRDSGLPRHLADLFPDSFEESELGEIPKGWQAKAVGDAVRLSRESLNPGDSPSEIFDHFSIPAFDMGKMPALDSGDSIKSQKLLVAAGSVLVSKLNPATPRVWLPPAPRSRRQVASTEFLVCVGDGAKAMSRELIYCLATSDPFLECLTSHASGTSNSHQRVRPQDFLDFRWTQPQTTVFAAFTGLVRPLFDQIQTLRDQSAILATLRDTLLPKLISGDLRIKDAERYLEKAT
jgi:type I restriction enzyme S subunit